MNRQKIAKRIILSILFLVGLLLSCCLISNGSSYYFQYELQQVTSRLGVESGSRGISTYIKDNVRLGMSKDDVENVFNNIGPTSSVYDASVHGVGPDDKCYVTTIKLNLLSIWDLQVYTCYSSRDRLTFLYSLNPEAYSTFNLP